MSISGRPEYAPINELQTMLRTVLPEYKLNQDGIYGEETRTAVSSYQRKRGLKVSGVTDHETWDAIKNEFNDLELKRAPAEPLLIVLQPNQVIEVGDENLHLYIMQAMLTALGRVDPGIPSLNVNGKLDEETAQAIRWLQELSGLEQTGSMDKKTWKYLTKHYRQVIGDGTGRIPVRRTQREQMKPNG